MTSSWIQIKREAQHQKQQTHVPLPYNKVSLNVGQISMDSRTEKPLTKHCGSVLSYSTPNALVLDYKFVFESLQKSQSFDVPGTKYYKI